MKPYLPFILALLTMLLLSGCQKENTPVCPHATGTPDYLTVPPASLPTPTPSVQTTVMIDGIQVSMDKVVTGPLCNDTWSGTVYVACNVQVYSWEESPSFLKDCDLKIHPGTVVYVAYHNNTAYYNGCSCHTNEIGGPK